MIIVTAAVIEAMEVETSLEAEVALEANVFRGTLMALEATMMAAIKARTLVVCGGHRNSGHG